MMPAEFVVSRSRRWGKKCDTFGLTNGRKSVGINIAQPEPAAIATVGIGTAMARGVHLAAAAACGDDGGWWGAGGLRARRGGVRTRVAMGLVGEARKGLRGTGELTGG